MLSENKAISSLISYDNNYYNMSYFCMTTVYWLIFVA